MNNNKAKKGLAYHVDHLEFYFAFILLSLMLVICMVNVLMRYFFSNAILWSDEVCRWMLIWSTMLGASYAVTKGGHLYVDIFYNVILKNHPKIIRVAKTVTAVFWIAICIVIAKYSLEIVLNSREVSPTTGVTRKVMLIALPVCMALMAIRVLESTIKLWLTKKQNGETVTEFRDGIEVEENVESDEEALKSPVAAVDEPVTVDAHEGKEEMQ